MGVSLEIAEFLMQARASGVRFDRVLTLGSQSVVASTARLGRLLKRHKLWPPACGEKAFADLMGERERRFEAFARSLGAQEVVACDASGYEGARLVHDLNLPVPVDWHERYDAVIDSGTLEHVFHFPVAIANCMRMVRTGGRLFAFTPANNYCGHGFYQFSPELFYRILVPENGFEMERMWAQTSAEGASRLFGIEYPFPITSPAYEVNDPAEIGQRVTLINRFPVLLYVQARKTAAIELFSKAPQQSDYVVEWRKAENTRRTTAVVPACNGVLEWMKRRLPEAIWRDTLPAWARWIDPFRWARFCRRHSFANRMLYQRVRRDRSTY